MDPPPEYIGYSRLMTCLHVTDDQTIVDSLEHPLKQDDLYEVT